MLNSLPKSLIEEANRVLNRDFKTPQEQVKDFIANYPKTHELDSTEFSTINNPPTIQSGGGCRKTFFMKDKTTGAKRRISLGFTGSPTNKHNSYSVSVQQF